MTLTTQQKNRLMAAAAAISALIGITAIATHDYNEETNSALGDAGLTRSIGESRVTDLLTGPVEPGETVVTGVTLPAGAVVTDVIGLGMFEVVEHTSSPRDGMVWVEVVARNKSSAPMRFVGFVSFDVPATDGGV